MSLPETYRDEKLTLASSFDECLIAARQRAKTLAKTANFYLAANQFDIYRSFRQALHDEETLIEQFTIQRDALLNAAILADNFIQRRGS